MTASHMFFDGKIVDIGTNYEEFKKNGTEVEYDVNDPDFMYFVKTIALSTKTVFLY